MSFYLSTIIVQHVEQYVCHWGLTLHYIKAVVVPGGFTARSGVPCDCQMYLYSQDPFRKLKCLVRVTERWLQAGRKGGRGLSSALVWPWTFEEEANIEALSEVRFKQINRLRDEYKGQSNRNMYSATVCMNRSITWVTLSVNTNSHANKFSFRHTANTSNKRASLLLS